MGACPNSIREQLSHGEEERREDRELGGNGGSGGESEVEMRVRM